MSDGVQPTKYVLFGIGEDGQFILAMEPELEEMEARGLVHKGSDAINAYFANKLAQQMLAEAKAKRIINPNGRVN
jgi:hypothetical protein